MPKDREKGSFSADIPEDAIAEAMAAVERVRAPSGEDAEGDEVRVEVEPEARPPGGAAAAPGAAERVAELTQKLAEEHDRLLRTAADLENFKKRAARERDEVVRFGHERLVKDVLPTLDNLDRALAAAPKDDPLASGVELTRRLLEDALSRHGVKGFTARGETFDPRVHEALMTVATDAAAPGTIVEEQQRGYYLHDRLLRPAAVVVAAAPARAAPAGEQPCDGAAASPDPGTTADGNGGGA